MTTTFFPISPLHSLSLAWESFEVRRNDTPAKSFFLKMHFKRTSWFQKCTTWKFIYSLMVVSCFEGWESLQIALIKIKQYEGLKMIFELIPCNGDVDCNEVLFLNLCLEPEKQSFQDISFKNLRLNEIQTILSYLRRELPFTLEPKSPFVQFQNF